MLTINKGTLVLKPSDLMIRSFIEAYAKDESEDKVHATKLFWYIHIRSQIDPEAPFYRVSAFEIESICKREVYKDSDYIWEKDNDCPYHSLGVQNMVDDYVAAYSTPEERMLKSYDHKLDEYREMLANTKPEIKENVDTKTHKVTYSSNAKLISDTMLGMEKIMIARDNLVAKIRQQGEKGEVRGQQVPSLLEQQHDEQS